MELGPNQTKWVEALESGEWKQGTAMLSCDDRYCCLGVAQELLGERPCGNRCHPHSDTVEALALRNEGGALAGTKLKGYEFLTDANDCGATFAEIAAFIRANPEAVFTESK